MTGVGRRGFLELTGAAGAAALSQVGVQVDPPKFDAYGVLIGPDGARPPQDGAYFNDFDTYQFVYIDTDRGFRHFVTDRLDGWSVMNAGGEELFAGDNTRISESEAGSTVIENTDGNPINIKLSPSGRAYLIENTTETVIDTQNEWTDIAGAWEDSNLNFLSHPGGSTLVYEGDVTTQIQYLFGGSYESPDNNAEYEIAVFKDGSVKSRTVLAFSPARKDEVLSLPGVFGFTDSTTEGMEHSVRVRCTSGATNITFVASNFVISG